MVATSLGGKANARLMAILCVGAAYFVIGVLLPLGLFLSGQHEWPEMKGTGLTFSSLAGVAGALGAICVIFASQAAVGAAKDAGLPPSTFRLYIAPLIFGLAPIINTLVSSIWHPKAGAPLHFETRAARLETLARHPHGWRRAALVLFSKEEAEVQQDSHESAGDRNARSKRAARCEDVDSHRACSSRVHSFD